MDDARVLARVSRVVSSENNILETLPKMLEQILREGMGGPAVAPNPRAEASSARSSKPAVVSAPKTVRRPWTKRPLVYLGALTTAASLVVGVALNEPYRGNFKETERSFRRGEPDAHGYKPLTVTEYGDLIGRRTLLNNIGVALGITGTGLMTYALGWGR